MKTGSLFTGYGGLDMAEADQSLDEVEAELAGETPTGPRRSEAPSNWDPRDRPLSHRSGDQGSGGAA